MDDLSAHEAAVELGVSPTVLSRLLEGGQLPSHLAEDGRRRRVLRSDLAVHRDQRFALRQRMVQEQRDRRWLQPEDDLTA
ncbi:MAG: hypothetical protein H7233_09555 [Pseudorhodobacter sp.]|nr:hypothetical protein [Frankiaceae bacterium]